MQDRYSSAIDEYEAILHKYSNNLIEMDTLVLANLCVCYILTKNNMKAEELLKKIESHEAIAKVNNPEK